MTVTRVAAKRAMTFMTSPGPRAGPASQAPEGERVVPEDEDPDRAEQQGGGDDLAHLRRQPWRARAADSAPTVISASRVATATAAGTDKAARVATTMPVYPKPVDTSAVSR